ncbi:PatB family C-S lyase [Sansalvadorimonas sp. 2012CJ34-2]|uniref:cysteine-S-conjugate beta-lyase n=1 Tax=Parendozoicomonas callyspongiae TaxID=2942213 RepID=A0ABT0PLN6_9GAMM|nr:PatB family C-S lyase [Sansalvadorimonas sp. 2012CJ34-2]MCL6271642.1 PatB family C-S lyase [Sansalvadorimonas sp. 2012CJ34-2]
MTSTLFNTPIDRRNTSSLKWDKYKDQDIIPMWVADMDFRSPPEIIDALHKRIDHGVFGYTKAPESLEQIVVERLNNLYDWPIEQQWLDWTPGLVSALNVAVRCCAEEGEHVIVPMPVYYPFLLAPPLGNRQMLQIFWRRKDGNWELDWDWLESHITDDTRLFMLCNPQNPNGRVLTRDELEKLEEFCRRHNLVACSDEVHCDLILDRSSQHIPYASISDYARDNSITLMSPSKTFNVAGLGCAFAVIPNPELRERFRRTRKGIVPDPDNMLVGYTAAEAAYTHGEPWRQALLEHLRENHDYLLQRIKGMPYLDMIPHQATYLAWIQCDIPDVKRPQEFFEQAGVGLSPGAVFGDARYVRLNFGCPKATLEQGLDRMEQALKEL